MLFKNKQAQSETESREASKPSSATGPVPQATRPVSQATGRVGQTTRPQGHQGHEARHQLDSATGPQVRPDLSDQEAEQHEGAKLHSRGRQILLFVLPIIALVLVGILILLIVNMPQPKEIQLERYTLPSNEQKIQATQPRATEVAETSAPKASEAPSYRLVSRSISKENLSKLISTGAGIPPGLQSEAVRLVDNPPKLVWQPPEGSSMRLPAVVSESKAKASPTENDQENLENADLPTLPVAPPVEEEAPLVGDEVLTPPAEEEYVETPEVLDDPVESLYTPNPEGEAVSSGFHATELPAYVYGELVNVRSDASMDSEVLTEAYQGDEVYEIETNGSWSRVRLADGFEGYIFSSLLSYNYVAPNPEPPAEVVPDYVESDFSSYSGTLYSTFSGVNIRALPSLDGEVVGSLYYGDSVTAVGYTGGWFQVLMNDGSTAYVHGDNLTEDPVVVEDISGEVMHEPVQWITSDIPEVETPSDLAGGNAIVGLAMQYQGFPYVYGAAGPNAFDCSGFTSYIYSQMGVTLGRTTYDQVNNGIPVSFSYKNYSNMVPGDLVLFATGAGIGHVGIYIGGGQFIHAANESVGVVVDSLNMDFWASSLAHVRRIYY